MRLLRLMMVPLLGGCFGSDKSDSGWDSYAWSDEPTGECAGYRSSYPAGPYGFGVGDVIDDLPGMVDQYGDVQSLVDIFGDRTKMALVLSNAFDT